MASRRQVWDLQAEGGPKLVDMWAVNAQEAVENEPSRYSFESPSGATVVDIPADWADLTAAKKRGLAVKLGADRTITTEDADAFIQAEVDRRNTAAPAQ